MLLRGAPVKPRYLVMHRLTPILSSLCVLGGAVTLGSCGKVVHASRYEVAQESLPFEGICTICPADPELLHAPCPVPGPAPDTGEVYARARLLVGIGAAVAQLYPHSTVAAEVWATTPQLRFGGLTPLQIMLEDGTDGMHRVVDYLMGQSPL
jgi:hypothetical protein